MTNRRSDRISKKQNKENQPETKSSNLQLSAGSNSGGESKSKPSVTEKNVWKKLDLSFLDDSDSETEKKVPIQICSPGSSTPILSRSSVKNPPKKATLSVIDVTSSPIEPPGSPTDFGLQYVSEIDQFPRVQKKMESNTRPFKKPMRNNSVSLVSPSDVQVIKKVRTVRESPLTDNSPIPNTTLHNIARPINGTSNHTSLKEDRTKIIVVEKEEDIFGFDSEPTSRIFEAEYIHSRSEDSDSDCEFIDLTNPQTSVLFPQPGKGMPVSSTLYPQSQSRDTVAVEPVKLEHKSSAVTSPETNSFDNPVVMIESPIKVKDDSSTTPISVNPDDAALISNRLTIINMPPSLAKRKGSSLNETQNSPSLKKNPSNRSLSLIEPRHSSLLRTASLTGGVSDDEDDRWMAGISEWRNNIDLSRQLEEVAEKVIEMIPLDETLEQELKTMRIKLVAANGGNGTPNGLSIQLLEHQVIGLCWMMRMENNESFRGGILADDMGVSIDNVDGENNSNFSTSSSKPTLPFASIRGNLDCCTCRPDSSMG
jgi:hypothetical protein